MYASSGVDSEKEEGQRRLAARPRQRNAVLCAVFDDQSWAYTKRHEQRCGQRNPLRNSLQHFYFLGNPEAASQRRNHGKDSGYNALRILLGACAALYIVAGFGIGTGELKAEIEAVRAGNTMPGQNLVDTYIFLFFIFAVQALEYTLDACLMIFGIELIKELELDPYSESCVFIAEALSKKSRVYLTTILLSSMALNVAQLLASSRLYNIDATVRIPVFSVALCLGGVVLTRLLGQGKELKEENDLYI